MVELQTVLYQFGDFWFLKKASAVAIIEIFLDILAESDFSIFASIDRRAPKFIKN